MQAIKWYSLELSQAPQQMRGMPTSWQRRTQVSCPQKVSGGEEGKEGGRGRDRDKGHRPVINLNGLIKVEHFKMEDLHPQDWMVKFDLKDSYLQVPTFSVASYFQSLPVFKLVSLDSLGHSLVDSCSVALAELVRVRP